MTKDMTRRLLGGSFVMVFASATAPGQTALPAGTPTQASEAPAIALPGSAVESPPQTPHVTCGAGQLTISAENATMGQVLTAVHDCLGVKIEVPAEVAAARTFQKFGPGPTREVLDALLSSTDSDFVIESSSSAPEKISAVLLMARNTAGPAVAGGSPGSAVSGNLSVSPARRAWLASRLSGRPVGSPIAEDEGARSAETTAASDPPDVAAPEPVAAAPEAPPTALPAAAATPSSPSDGGTPSPAKLAADPAAPNTPAGSAPPADPSTTGAPPSAAPPDSSAAPAPPASQELRNRINGMQQMFEQRKKMNTAPASPPN